MGSNKEARLIGMSQVTAKLFDNGTASLSHNAYLIPGGRIIPSDLGTVEQPARNPFRPSELLVMAACEWLARDLQSDEDARL